MLCFSWRHLFKVNLVLMFFALFIFSLARTMIQGDGWTGKTWFPSREIVRLPSREIDRASLIWCDRSSMIKYVPLQSNDHTQFYIVYLIYFSVFCYEKVQHSWKSKQNWTQSPEMTGKWAMRKSPLCDFDYIMHFWRGKLTWNVVYCWYSCAFPLVTLNHIFNKQILMRHYKL